LAEDEALHEKQFRALMEEVPKDQFVSSTDEQLQYLRAMSLSEFFMGEKGLYKKLEEIKDENDGLMRSFELEKATLQYYGAMREVMGENETINAIIKAEKGHLMKIMRYLITDAKFRGISDDYP
jgi:rubrerythrin